MDAIEIETLRSDDLIRKHQVVVGGTVLAPTDLVEMRLPEGLRAEVLAIEACPAIADGPGQVILTTVNHLNRDLRALTSAVARKKCVPSRQAPKRYPAEKRVAATAWHGSNARAFVIGFGRPKLETPLNTKGVRTESAKLNRESASYAAYMDRFRAC